MDKRILTILKEVAQEHTQDFDGMDLSCVFCSGDGDYSNSEGKIDDIIHDANCPTTLARAILREANTPLCAYRIAYVRRLPHYPDHAIENDYRTGFTVDEVKNLYQDKSIHNIQISYVKDM